jgi:uncharacterized protein YlxW (UPF0749 family)
MIQFRTQGKIEKAQLAESATDQTAIISNLYEANVELRREVGKLAAQQEEYRQSVDESGLTDMVSELNTLRVFTGLSEVSGPGVELTVDAEVRPEYVQDLINEFRNAGSEALALNEQRIVAASAVTAYQGKVVVNQTIVERPLVFRAVGNPDTLDRALGRKGGMLSFLRNTYPNAQIDLAKQSTLTLPLYRGNTKLKVAQPAPEK